MGSAFMRAAAARSAGAAPPRKIASSIAPSTRRSAAAAERRRCFGARGAARHTAKGAALWRWNALQADRGDPCRNVEAGRAFDADRLQRDRVVVAADHDTGGGLCRRAAKIAGERTRRRRCGRGEYGPHQDPALDIADIDPEPVDGAGIMLDMPARARECAIERTRRPEHKSKPARHVATEKAGFDPLRMRRSCQPQAKHDHQHTGCTGQKSVHLKTLRYK